MLILLTLVGMGVLFGVGFGLGQLLLSGDSSTASGGSSAAPSGAASPTAQPCVTVQATPSSVPASNITVDVLNSGAPAGSAKTASEQLGAAGFLIGNVANGQSTQTGSPAVVRYGTGGVDKARTVAAWINGNAAMEEDPSLGGSVQLVLLPAYSGIASSDAAQAKLSQPVPVASGPGCSPSAAAASGAASASASSDATSGSGQQGNGTSDQGSTTDSGQGTQGTTQNNQ